MADPKDRLREAIAQELWWCEYGGEIDCNQEDWDAQRPDERIVYQQHADAVLAVLDQQGWGPDCPTVEATEPATPESPLREHLARWVDDNRREIVDDLTYHDNGSEVKAAWQDFLPFADAVIEALNEVALREAGRYEPSHWLRGNTLLVYGGPNAVLENDGWVPLYRRVTTDEGGE